MNELLQVEFDFCGPPLQRLSECGCPAALQHRESFATRTAVMPALGKSLVAAAILLLTAGCSSQQQVSFHRDIYPILQRNCAACHSPPAGPGYGKSGLIVSSYQDLMRGTKLGPVIVPGSSVASTLIRLIQHQADPEINMPKEYTVQERLHDKMIMPGTKARWLKQGDIDLITAWVDQGAKDN